MKSVYTKGFTVQLSKHICALRINRVWIARRSNAVIKSNEMFIGLDSPTQYSLYWRRFYRSNNSIKVLKAHVGLSGNSKCTHYCDHIYRV